MRILFKDWAPDRDEYETPCVVAENVWPATGGGFGPALSWSQWSTFSSSNPYTYIYATQYTDGTDLNLAGADEMHKIEKATSTNLMTGIAPWGVATGAKGLDFTTFRDKVVVSGGSGLGATALASLDLTNTASVFALLTGSPPYQAYAVGRVRDFLVFGDINDSGGNEYPSRVQWSGFNNEGEWGSNASTQADFQDLQLRYGGVVRIVPGTVGYIFQESAITTMRYVGPPTIFRFDTIAEDIPIIARRSIAWTDQHCFFHSKNGFKTLDLPSGRITSIGAGRVDEWFSNAVHENNIAIMQCAIDQRRKLVMWSFDTTGDAPGAGNRFDRILVYNWDDDRWSYVLFDHRAIGEFQLNDDVDGRDTTLVAYVYDGSSDYDAGFLDGFGTAVGDNAMDARMQTGFNGIGGAHQYLDGARVMVEISSGQTPTITMRCNHKVNRLTDSTSNTGDVAINDNGRHDFRVNARYFQFEPKVTGAFRRIIGVEAAPKPSSGR